VESVAIAKVSANLRGEKIAPNQEPISTSTAKNPLKQNNCLCVSLDGLLQVFGKASFVITSDKK
jgi:hypothetical protein